MRRLTTGRAAVAIVFLLLFAMACRVSVDPDMWWHLRLGEHTLATGQPVYADVFSHTRAGVVHQNHSWLAQVVMLGFWRLGGHLGLTLYVATLATGGMFLLHRAGSGGIYMQGFVLVFGAACAAAFWSPRPQMFTFFFSACVVYLLFDLKRNGRDRLRWLPLLLWLWGNCHGGYAFGFVLIGGFLCGEALNHAFAIGESPIPIQKLRQLLLLALLSLSLLPLNPLGLEVFAVPFKTIGISGLRDHIQEWQAPDLSQPYTWGFVILLILLLGAVAGSRRRLDTTEIFLAFGTLGLALLSGRNLPLFAIAAVPIATFHCDIALARRGWSIQRRSRETPQRALVNLGLIGLVAWGALLHLQYVTNHYQVEKAVSLNFPLDAVRHLNGISLEDNLFNSYNWGGYLMYMGGPHPVFIDGRTDLYHDLLADYVIAVGASSWTEIFEQWDISIALIETSSYLAAQLSAASDWRRQYADDLASVFLKSG